MTSPADLLAAKQAAERIVAAHAAYDWRTSEFDVWQQYVRIAIDNAPLVARAFLALPDVQAAHWVPVAAGGRK